MTEATVKTASATGSKFAPTARPPRKNTLSKFDPEERKMILYSSHFTRTLWSLTYSAQSQAQCWECMRVCPVGAEKRTKR